MLGLEEQVSIHLCLCACSNRMHLLYYFMQQKCTFVVSLQTMHNHRCSNVHTHSHINDEHSCKTAAIYDFFSYYIKTVDVLR